MYLQISVIKQKIPKVHTREQTASSKDPAGKTGCPHSEEQN